MWDDIDIGTASTCCVRPSGTSPSLVYFRLDLGQTSAVCQRSVRAFATPANGTPSQAPFWVAPRRSAAVRKTAMTTNAPESLPRSKKGGEVHGRARGNKLGSTCWGRKSEMKHNTFITMSLFYNFMPTLYSYIICYIVFATFADGKRSELNWLHN